MNEPDATITTATSVNVTTPEDDDGVIPEPGRNFANVLWLLRQVVLGAGIIWLLAVLGLMVWTPDQPKGATDAATLVAVLGLLVNAFMVGFTRRQG